MKLGVVLTSCVLATAGCSFAPSGEVSNKLIVYHTGAGSAREQSPFRFLIASNKELLQGDVVETRVSANRPPEMRTSPDSPGESSVQRALIGEQTMRDLLDYLDRKIRPLVAKQNPALADSDKVPRIIELRGGDNGFQVRKDTLEPSGQKTFFEAERVLLVIAQHPSGGQYSTGGRD